MSVLFEFAPAIQALINSGQLVPLVSKMGQILPIAVDPKTRKFVAHAIGIAYKLDELPKFPINPMSVISLHPAVITTQVISGLVTGSVTIYQNHQIKKQGEEILQCSRQILQGVTALTQSVGVLQATTAFIGVGVVANIAISAVNLHQTLKLREDVKQLRAEVKDGFIDLKKSLADQGAEIIAHIDRVADDVEFRSHRTILSRAYALFVQATDRLKVALMVEDPMRRDADINSARDMMFKALADYENPHLLQNVCAAGYIRRRACVWAIQQAIIMTYQLQGEHQSASSRLQELQATIRRNAQSALDLVGTEAELDFLFPEILHICNHDLVALDLWQTQLDWARSLSAEEVKLLSPSELQPLELSASAEIVNSEPLVIDVMAVPPEQVQYEAFKQKSHFVALKDQLKLKLAPELRESYMQAIETQASKKGLKALLADNLSTASEATIANLYHYLQPAN
ncbi:hypothetical protein [Alkalinema sp. FACHB-956]|uniref:hypothetical protein n=1 Tax=Alkalinema sp. FACHB-956 TaxID=2692768 RepID=UPI001685A82C|nr:hypothetical protein [Alkalinema sp. FACHB-956]MBD2329532.1 hypothetical protein [Alkalinema sp. FACHB-956]